MVQQIRAVATIEAEDENVADISNVVSNLPSPPVLDELLAGADADRQWYGEFLSLQSGRITRNSIHRSQQV